MGKMLLPTLGATLRIRRREKGEEGGKGGEKSGSHLREGKGVGGPALSYGERGKKKKRRTSLSSGEEGGRRWPLRALLPLPRRGGGGGEEREDLGSALAESGGKGAGPLAASPHSQAGVLGREKGGGERGGYLNRFLA